MVQKTTIQMIGVDQKIDIVQDTTQKKSRISKLSVEIFNQELFPKMKVGVFPLRIRKFYEKKRFSEQLRSLRKS